MDSCVDITATILPDPPANEAPLQDHKQYLDRQLDSLIGQIILESLQVLGGNKNRLHGGVPCAVT
jgi:hypothetical protein